MLVQPPQSHRSSLVKQSSPEKRSGNRRLKYDELLVSKKKDIFQKTQPKFVRAFGVLEYFIHETSPISWHFFSSFHLVSWDQRSQIRDHEKLPNSWGIKLDFLNVLDFPEKMTLCHVFFLFGFFLSCLLNPAFRSGGMPWSSHRLRGQWPPAPIPTTPHYAWQWTRTSRW